MYIESFVIQNYKSFSYIPQTRLSAGFNIVVGQNNSGKTAFLEAMSLRFSDKPHLNPNPKPTLPYLPNTKPLVSVIFKLSHTEILDLLSLKSDFFLPVYPQTTPLNEQVNNFLNGSVQEFDLQADYSLGKTENTFIQRFISNQAVKMVVKGSHKFEPENSRYQYYSITPDQSFAFPLAQDCRDRIYTFKAERMNIGKSLIGTKRELDSNCINLPEVLLNLSNNAYAFKRFNEMVTFVLPQVKQVTPYLVSPAEVEIRVWGHDPISEREEFAFPLSESGTGISQVLAILYVIFTSNTSRIIAIDEPQSFLHPGAVRKLIDILKQHPQHQYIITTHSPNVISAAEPETLLLINKADGESSIELLRASDLKSMERLLTEIGAKLSDVFGADEILWVEGPTEARCFPLILSQLVHQPLFGRSILSVKHTSDFDNNTRAKTALDIYQKLSSSNGLIPLAIGFIFDREDRSEIERKDLIRQSNSKVYFTQRKMYENYLLNPDVIAAAINSIEGFRDIPITTQEIEEWIFNHKWEKDYFKKVTLRGNLKNEKFWLENVDGAKLFKDLFAELSEARFEYDKVIYGELLTTKVLEMAPDDLAEIAKLLRQALKIKSV